jgi:cell wall-associated NlpC family hydrolase
MPIDTDLMIKVHDIVEVPGNQYKMGGKPDLFATADHVSDLAIDCSGYVRWLLHKATRGAVTIPDGSYIQHDYIEAQGYKHSSVEAGKLHDGCVRVAFLAPRDGRAGHVAIIYQGETIESHGGTGPDRREWTGARWQGLCTVYALTKPIQKGVK